jgi:hypothetical protein
MKKQKGIPLGIDGRIILKWVLKQMGLMLTAFKRLKTGSSGEQNNELWIP